MIDEKIIEGLREYIKDHYIPADKIVASVSIAGVSSSRSMCVMACAVNEISSFRDISDEATQYIKEHRKPGGFAHTLDRLRNERELIPAE